MGKVTNEKKNLSRLTGEFLVASKLTQKGYMISLQWGTTIGYDILVFDKSGNIAYVEVKTTASYTGRWTLQEKYAGNRKDNIPIEKRFVACVDITDSSISPVVYFFPLAVIQKGLQYHYNNAWTKSKSLKFHFDSRPKGESKNMNKQTMGDYLDVKKYVDNFKQLKLEQILT